MSLDHTAAVATAAEPVARPVAAVRYTIDPGHSATHFKVRHLMVAHVRGELGQVAGEVLIDPSNLARSSVTASIDARGIATRNPDRDAHLRSADFLDVEQHPTIEFRSTSVRTVGDGELEVDGLLTIRGVTGPVTLQVELSDEVKDPWGNRKRGASATARIDRKDYGLTWNAALETGGFVVGDRVDISIELELVRAEAQD
jgi:polyisoprenoid-binding protein YceI